jgi:uncharacterized protein (DUF2062 family)
MYACRLECFIIAEHVAMDKIHDHLTNVTMADQQESLFTSIVSALLVGAHELTATRILISAFLLLTVARWVSTQRKRASQRTATPKWSN